jgi:hypothetical protein
MRARKNLVPDQRSLLVVLVLAMSTVGCIDLDTAGGSRPAGDIGVIAQAIYPGPLPEPGGFYTPIFGGRDATQMDQLCNSVRNTTATTITLLVSYDARSSESVAFNIVRGTSGDDTLGGSDGSDLICGYEGNDTLRGGLGNDIIIGGQGNDIIYGGCGQDFLWGGAGNDTIYGDSGTSNVCGGTLTPGSPDADNPIFWDIIYGGPGSDTIFGEWGFDAIFGGDFTADDSVDTINCGQTGTYGGIVYVLRPSSGSGWIADTVTGCDSVSNVP